ncbi:hypothetical protein AVEN_35099-1 [Araneus ventricosus]|uniref:Uncharacterized protein n=1 Tax=Araneus ventricosus TaxID=182803 RepID=A0A4Y2I5W7_ARAVE|nr:hypothetical protein AVEN_35099-1 [Araneus ventricosus]
MIASTRICVPIPERENAHLTIPLPLFSPKRVKISLRMAVTAIFASTDANLVHNQNTLLFFCWKARSISRHLVNPDAAPANIPRPERYRLLEYPSEKRNLAKICRWSRTELPVSNPSPIESAAEHPQISRGSSSSHRWHTSNCGMSEQEN